MKSHRLGLGSGRGKSLRSVCRAVGRSAEARSVNGGKGFTLIELLIVVAIIAILAAIAIPNFLEAQVRSKVSRSQNDLRQLQLSLITYMTDNQRFPPQATVGTVPADRIVQRAALNRLTTPISYITSIPNDPFSQETESQVLRRPYYVSLPDLSGIDPHGMEVNKFIVGSVGPDGKQELAQLVGELYYYSWIADTGVYDPTNGTVSAGDVAKTACASIGGPSGSTSH